jgi:predicted alpha/beta hydrolase family esterase
MFTLLAVIASGAAHTQQAQVPAPGDERELVVLVHGMGRSRLSMYMMGRSLEQAGYRVVNWGYSSTSRAVPELGEELADAVRTRQGAAPRVHFVTHSLGSIIVRWSLANAPPAQLGRVVMLAPPNQGSRAADRMARWVGWLLPPIRELRTDSTATARTLPLPAEAEVGVIAGERDGKVTVAESHLEGEREHVVVRSHHTFIMNRRDVRGLVQRFLATGSFGDGARPAH